MQSLIRLTGLVALLAVAAVWCLAATQPPAKRTDDRPVRIVVESVRGRAQFARSGRFQPLRPTSQLRQGDTVVVEIASIAKLEFQHPDSGAVLAAAILKGYTEMTVGTAYIREQQTRIRVDVPQGLVRAGVVRTAVPPSFVVRSPRVVVAVRGTEIAELEVSHDRGDHLLMGRIGTVRVHDSVPLSRSAQAGQGTRKRTEPDRRGSALLRAIEHARLTHRVFQTGPHRRGLEIDYDRRVTFDPVEFNPGEFFRSEGNPGRDRLINSQGARLGRRPVPCPFCEQGTGR